MAINEIRFSFEAGGIRIPAALTLPPRKTPRWGIVLVPGSFNNDIDGNYSYADGNPFELRPHTNADLARQLADHGHAVLRYARAGTTVVDTDKAQASRTFAARADVVAAAVAELRRRIPGETPLAVAGHSEGAAVVLLLLTTRTDAGVKAYISLSGPGMRFFDVMVAQSAPNVQKDGKITFAGFTFPFDLYCRSFEYVRAGEPIPEDIRAVLPPFGVHAMPPAAQKYLIEYDRLDPAAAIAQVDIPVFIVQGGSDTSVTPENAERLLIARQGKETMTGRAFFPELNHFYKLVPPGTPPSANFGLENETDPRVADAVSDWLDELIIEAR
jgi:uncharacterized protein